MSGVAPTKRSIRARGRKRQSANTIADPTVAGAVLTMFASGATPSSQAYPMPATYWAPTYDGFKYTDAQLLAGSVKSAQVKLVNGTLGFEVVVAGATGGITVVPPDGATSACFRLQIKGGDRYDVLFPPPPDSTIERDNAKIFQVRDAAIEGLCD